MAKILLVEDNTDISEGLRVSFKESCHQLITTETIFKAKAIVLSDSLDLVLLDITLPDGDGRDFFAEILEKKKIPTIFLTARDSENDIVRGLSLGAEDYICKPFSVKELMARVTRTLKRNEHEEQKRVKVGSLEYDFDTFQIYSKGEKVTLSALENKILNLLMTNRGKVVSRDQIIDLIWDATGNDVFDHTVTVYIKRLRKKLGEDIIETVKGVGYLIS